MRLFHFLTIFADPELCLCLTGNYVPADPGVWLFAGGGDHYIITMIMVIMLHEIELFHNSTSQKMKLFVNSKALLYCISILLIWYIYKNQFCLYNI